MSPRETAEVAALFADPSRAAMLDLLLDGAEHPVGSLANAADVSSSTATGHLGRLEARGLVVSRRYGRQRLVRLTGPSVASAFEALSLLSRPAHTNGLRAWNRHEQLSAARTCYDHLAGRLGVAVAEAARTSGALDDDFGLAPDAPHWFARLGVDLSALPKTRRPLLRTCIDWTERREHLAGALGAAVCSAVLAAGWAERVPGTRALHVTVLGETQLQGLGVATAARGR
jgi:DNA-binding transcriptional ArsR family regulator